VLYEMLVGEPPYSGRTAQAVLVRILTEPAPAATKTRASIPPNVDSAIRKALERLPADRFADAQEFARALGDPGFRQTAGSGAPAATGAEPWKRVAFAAAALALVATTLAAWSLSRPGPTLRVERFVAPFGDAQEPPFNRADAFALSPDGSAMVYRGQGEGQGPPQLWARRWDELEPSPIYETGMGTRPTFSPDGQEVAFVLRDEIQVASIQGGSLRTLGTGSWPHWGRDGYVYAASGEAVVRVRPTGGAADTVMLSAGGDARLHDVLPGGSAALIRVARPDDAGTDEVRVEGLRLDTGETTVIAVGDAPRYLDSGHLVYLAPDSTLMAARFDPEALEFLEQPVAVLGDVLSFSLTDSGNLLYSRALAEVGTEFVWVNRDGQALPVDPGWTFDQGVGNAAWSLSPDGRRAALKASDAEGNDDIWIKELVAGGPNSRITFDEGQDWSPRWSPDGTMVTFVSIRLGDRDVWTKRADGTGAPELLYDHETRVTESFWSPDGEWLVLRGGAASAAQGTRDIVAVRPGVDPEVLPLLVEAYDEQQPMLSPDGRWLAYVSDENGSNDVFVRPFPDVDAGKWQVSANGGIMPLWANSGRELFYVDPSNRLIAVQVGFESGFEMGDREELFTIPYWYRTTDTNSVYGVSPDDQRFLMARAYQPQEGSPSSFVLVQNFGEELKRLVPR
jgi:serine/threonine-protein kinase